MEIKKSRYSGYCFGVKRALNLTEKILQENRSKNVKIYTLGSIIHNSGVTRGLAGKGLISIRDLGEIEPNSIFIIRSHGMSPRLIKKIKAKDAVIIDATCPFVKKAQARAENLSKNGYFVVIIGNKNHPEVIGIKDHVMNGEYTVVENEIDADNIKSMEKIGIVVQTTQTIDKLKLIKNKLLEKTRKLLIYNTICSTTKKRQDSTRKLSKSVDIMIVVGGKNSANTTHLKEMSEKYNKLTYHIENYRELKPEWFKNKTKAGIIGGASTPERDIIGVIEEIEKI